MNLVVANWKMNPPGMEDARVIASRVEHGMLTVNRRAVHTVICPPHVFLSSTRHYLHFASLGAQDVAAEKDGAFTGEVSAVMLRAVGAGYCIVGHSERRAMGEDDTIVNQKIHRLLENKITPILCVGFGAKKNAGLAAVKRIVQTQVQKGLEGVKDEAVIAYEPVWAIGSGKPATPAHAAEVLEYIGKMMPKARLLYGGSMDGSNAKSFAAQEIIQGGLVGGASLQAEEFIKIVKAFS